MTNKPPSPPKRKMYNVKKSKTRKNIRRLAKEDDAFSDFSDSDNTTQHREKQSSFNITSNSIETAKTECDITNTTTKTEYTLPHNNLETELNASLSNLDLGNSHSVFNNSKSKPLLSPSKLNSVTRNPWTAGGFWSNPYSCPSPEPGPCNLSRSSSHSSGFGSHTNENLNVNSLPASPGNSVSGGDDQLSVFSEPPYQLGNGQFELYKSGNGSIAASLYSPTTSGSFSVHDNPFQRTMGGMLWNKRCSGISSFAYTSRAVNLNWPHRNGYAMGSLFKNLGDSVKTDSFKKIRY